ncbi:MAG: metallopeptidase family protein [Gammaproteobacteria bacterium]
MKRSEFESVVREAIEGLDDWVREALHNIEVLVLDEADEELDPGGEGLLGLYTGIPLTERSVEDAGELPDVIYIFRRPHLEMGLAHDELCVEIRKTLLHEIAHYFGIDDDHLDEIGYA